MKKSIATLLFFVALTYPHSRAAADSVSRDLTFSVSAGGFSFAKQDELRSEPVFDIRLGYDIIGNNITDSLGIEGGLSYVSTFSKKDNTPVSAYLFRVDAIYPFYPRKRFIPFFTVGAGGMFMDRGDSMDNAPVLAYGFGLKYFVQEFIAMRLDLRHNILFEIGTRNDFQYMFGLSFLLDRDKKIRRLPLPPPPPVETKKLPPAPALPVIDFNEKPAEPVPVPTPPEPEKEPEAKQEDLPLSLPAVVAAPIAIAAQALTPSAQPTAEIPKAKAAEPAPERATPQPESQPEQPAPRIEKPARRPAAPAPQPVWEQAEPAASAAPLEQAVAGRTVESPAPTPARVSDEDVVASILCPIAPPAGTKPRVLKEPAAVVLFDSGSAAVKKKYLPGIRRIARYVKENPGSSVYIEGHADRIGKPEMNMRLSQRRVASVKKSLTQGTGLKKVKVITSAFGCRVPVETNRKAKGRLKNRRATIEVTTKD